MKWSPGQRKHSQAATDFRSPLRRTDDLITEAVEDELLVYDRTNSRAHCLSSTAARVWEACDGRSDPTAISTALGLSLDVVREAVAELEAADLLDHRLEVVNVGNGNGRGVTRRELAVRSARVGTAAAVTAPLILSITAPTALAAVTPSFVACAISTGNSCGNSAGECGFIEGCCCCCDWVSGGQCMLCTPAADQCPHSGGCPDPFTVGGPGSRASCSSGQTGTNPPNPSGCCGTAAVGNCGCAFSPTGEPGTGLANGGPGCCVPGDTPGSGTACTQGSAGCVPCCNGDPLPTSGVSAAPGCCADAATGAGLCGIAA